MVGTDDDDPVTGTYDSVKHEHAQVEMISRAIAETDSIDLAASLLREHRGMLAHHFAEEEADGGLYETILEVGPHHERKLAALRAQHGEMLELIDELLQLEQDDDRPADLLDRAKAIAKMLKEHESEEGSLLMEVFNTDIGVGD